MDNVIISLKGIQTGIDNKTNTIELMSEAKFYKKDDTYYIVYKETEITGMEGTTTTVKVCEDTISLIRFGTICSNMVFKEGYKHKCSYDTLYGSLDVVVQANTIKTQISDSGGELYIDYDIEVGGNKLGSNNFYIRVIERKE